MHEHLQGPDLPADRAAVWLNNLTRISQNTQGPPAGRWAFFSQYILGHEDMTTVREYVKVAARDVKDLYRSPPDALEV